MAPGTNNSKDNHSLGVRGTALLLEKTVILNTALIKQPGITLDYTSSRSQIESVLKEKISVKMHNAQSN